MTKNNAPSLFQSLFGDSGIAYLYALANKRKKASNKTSSKKSPLRTIVDRLSVMTGLAAVAGMKSMSASQDPDSRLSGGPERAVTGSPGRSVIIKANTKVVPVVEIRRTEST
eukprot:gene3252-3565_t